METLRFDHRVAIITGVGNIKGLGFAYARLLGSRGAKIVAADLHVSGEVISGLKDKNIDVTVVEGDITKMCDAQKIADCAIKTYGRVDILINNAGACRNVPADIETEEVFDFILKVNTYGTRNVIHAVLPSMIKQHYGRIINTTSSAGMYGLAECYAYSAAKGAVYGLTRSLALWGQQYAIKVNAVAPSAATQMALNDSNVPEEAKEQMRNSLSPEAVAPVVAVLAHESCEVTGRVLESAGGGTGEIFVGTTMGIMNRDNSPEFILEHWDRVRDRSQYEVIDDIYASDCITVRRMQQKQ